jgi:hypothetical protein
MNKVINIYPNGVNTILRFIIYINKNTPKKARCYSFGNIF